MKVLMWESSSFNGALCPGEGMKRRMSGGAQTFSYKELRKSHKNVQESKLSPHRNVKAKLLSLHNINLRRWKISNFKNKTKTLHKI